MATVISRMPPHAAWFLPFIAVMMSSIVRANDGRATGWFRRQGNIDPVGIRLGMAWVKNALQERTRGGDAVMWWWEAAEEPPSFTLHIVGADGQVASKTFSIAMLRACTTNARVGATIRHRIENLLDEVTESPCREPIVSS